MPFEWYSTYGSEFIAARIATDHIIEHRNSLRYLDIRVHERSFMFGDNKSVVDSSSVSHAKLHKWHTALSFHSVREAIASGIIVFNHIPGKLNPAEFLVNIWDTSKCGQCCRLCSFGKVIQWI